MLVIVNFKMTVTNIEIVVYFGFDYKHCCNSYLYKIPSEPLNFQTYK